MMKHSKLWRVAMMAICMVAAFGYITSSVDASWYENVSIKGDLRYRHESTDKETDDETRERHRIRARLSITGDVNDQVTLGIRLASGSADPVSTNQTLDGGFSSKNFWLDRAYFDWHPTEKFKLIGGKMANPFYSPGDSQLLWDGDLNPEGLAIKVNAGNETIDFFANAGGFWVEERKNDGDSMLYGAQAGLKFGDKTNVIIGGSFFTFTEAKGYEPFVDPDDSFGNSLDGVVYATDFSEIEGFVVFGTQLGSLPLSIFGDYVVNSDADEDDSGYVFGFKLGKAKNPWSWEFKYDYHSVERDAVVGAFCSSDFGGGGTNAEGHVIGVGVALAKHVKAGVTYFMDEIDPDGEAINFDRLQIDAKFNF